MEEKKDIKKIIIIIESVVIALLLFYIGALLKDDKKPNTFTEAAATANSKYTDGSISISKNNNKEKNGTIKLAMNETVTKDNKYELTVIGTNFGKTILPPNTSSYYTYYEAKTDGHQYLEVKYNYKNLAESNVRSDNILSMTIKYDNKYEYTGFCVIEDDESDFTYANITNIAPLTTGKLHYLFDLPDDVVNGEGSIVATLKSGNDIYEIVLR